jgi:hypothetical protein
MSVSGTIKFAILFQVFIIGFQRNIYSQVLINEVMASNATSFADRDYGKYCDWIELYNTTTKSIDLSGYFLSDDSGNLSRWQFRAGSVITAHDYLIVYADGLDTGLHTNFNLAKEGEKVLLVNKQGTIIDSLSFPYQLTDISYGRKRNDPHVFGYFEVPTPGEINDYQMAKGISPAPVFSVRGGFYPGPQTVGISVASKNAEIFYTLDGTEPSKGSIPYTDSILLT